MPTTTTTTDQATMLALVQREYGGAETLQLHRIARPRIGAGEVLVEVHAAGVDRGALHLMTGTPRLVRLMGYGLRAPKDPVRGRELAGRVVEVGPGVEALQPGDEVFGVGEGTFAKLARCEAAKLVPIPAELTMAQAAALPISGLTALHLVRAAGVEAGDTVLVIGASGGVGSFAVQLAAARGAEVTGVASGPKADFVRSLGAAHVIDHTAERIGDRGVRYDAIFDLAGNRPLRELRRTLAPKGTLLVAGGEGGGPWLGGVDRQLRAALWSPFVSQRLRGLMSKESGDDLQALADLVADGSITPAVDRTFPLSDAPAALRSLEQGKVRGKVVVTVR